MIKVPDPVPRRRRGRLGIASRFPSGFEAMGVNRSHSFAFSSVKYLGLARQVSKMLEILWQREHDRHLLGVNSSIDACLFSLTPSKIARLQSIAGSNPMLAKQAVQEAKLGRHFPEGKGSEYINVAPFINAIFTALGIIRFVGLGLGDRSLYIFGGIAMLIAISLRYMGIGLNQAARRKPLGKK
mgnify:CR=1 FL=1